MNLIVILTFSLYMVFASALDFDNDPSNADLFRLIQKLNATVANLENRLAQSETSTVVGFFSRLEGHDVKLGLNQGVIFNRVITNIGNGYDARHGHFTAPVQGLYHFIVSVMAMPNKTLFLHFVKNGAFVENIWASGSTYTSTTKSVIISLNIGDMVWVREPSNAIYVGEVIHAEHTTFSGHLISV